MTLDTSSTAWPPVAITKPGDLRDLNFVIDTTLRPGTARSCGLRIRTGDSEFTEVGYDRDPGAVYVDRRKSGNVDFHQAFAGRHEAPTRVINGKVELQIIVDRSSVEVFINDGETVISDRIFPTTQEAVIEIFTGDDSAQVTDTIVHQLGSLWRK